MGDNWWLEAGQKRNKTQREQMWGQVECMKFRWLTMHPVLEKDWEPGEPPYSRGHIEIVSSKQKVAMFMSHRVEVGSLRDTIPDLLSRERDPEILGWKDLFQGPPQLRLARPRTRQHAVIPGFSCSHSLFPVSGTRTWSGYTGHDSSLTNWEMHLPC